MQGPVLTLTMYSWCFWLDTDADLFDNTSNLKESWFTYPGTLHNTSTPGGTLVEIDGKFSTEFSLDIVSEER
ncbi:unnamed protein product [Strongylus vulgaris]|uniref:Uncharacterized protein n=1 Tax=Strongylus vulgaris TaxID=40348 RepID=A0A3P7IFK0_STRVU|nr:unnamed protein product [Strongylus vulgaris]